jgi:predicted branched-subunit amino acid permease
MKVQGMDIKEEKKLEFNQGLRKGMPITLGYVPVAFTFGLLAVQGGLPPWLAVVISMSNLTSAGQFAGVNLIIAQATLAEITLTTFVINIRYLLMSLSLSQRIKEKMPVSMRSIMAFGITDEIFTVASMEEGEISFPFMMGLISGPFFGWAVGTALGAYTSSLLSPTLQGAMGIALYAMFIAIVIPAARASKAALVVAGAGISINSILTWMPMLNISSGWRITIATILAASLGALLFPKSGEEHV